MHKMVTCMICEKEVTKRSTLAFGGERACRTHEDVIDHISKLKAYELMLCEVEAAKEGSTLSDAQISNWRRILSGTIGPYALIMPASMIQSIRDKLQRNVNTMFEGA